jgi:uncharacterized protein YcgL (UPF0745 family)
LIAKLEKMAFKNPWGKGSKDGDRWFDNTWDHEKTNDLVDDDPPYIDHWDIKTSGQTSSDNTCANCPVSLGIDVDPPHFSNGIELKAYIANHKSGYLYNISRTAKLTIWEYSGKGGWVKTYDKPSYNDDHGNRDEMLTPKQSDASKKENLHYIYVEDRPAFTNPPNGKNNPDSTLVVFVVNMEEFVMIKNSQTQNIVTDTNKQKWHMRMYIKLENSVWKMDKSLSSVGKDHISETQPTD